MNAGRLLPFYGLLVGLTGMGAGSWHHWRQGMVDKRVIRALAIGSFPVTLLAVATLFRDLVTRAPMQCMAHA